MTEQAKHTPGPWEVRTELDSNRKPYYISICPVNAYKSPNGTLFDRSVAEVYICPEGNEEGPHLTEALANANLIAASPELLMALKYLNKRLWVDTLNDKGRPTIKTPITETDAYVIQAAIAKAEGSL